MMNGIASSDTGGAISTILLGLAVVVFTLTFLVRLGLRFVDETFAMRYVTRPPPSFTRIEPHKMDKKKTKREKSREFRERRRKALLTQ
jgi:hypothetical protein